MTDDLYRCAAWIVLRKTRIRAYSANGQADAAIRRVLAVAARSTDPKRPAGSRNPVGGSRMTTFLRGLMLRDLGELRFHDLVIVEREGTPASETTDGYPRWSHWVDEEFVITGEDVELLPNGGGW